MSAVTPALSIEALDVAFRTGGHDAAVLKRVNLTIAPGEAYGLVGESGSGKSTVALAALRYLPPNGRMTRGRVRIGGAEVLALDPGGLRRLRAHGVALVSQDPARALNPAMRVGAQVAEVFRLQGLSRAEARARAVQMLGRMRIADPASVAARYPHQLSGGMQQRAAIAMALSGDPSLLVLDEPTTGLDTTVEAEILDLIAGLRAERGMALLFISHNLEVVAGLCDRVGVLYAGELVEEGPTAAVFAHPRHPYTAGLLRCRVPAGRLKSNGRLDAIPGLPPAAGELVAGCAFHQRCALAVDRCRTEPPPVRVQDGRLSRCHFGDLAETAPAADVAPSAAARERGAPLLVVEGLAKTYGSDKAPVRALRDVSFEIAAGETLGLVGESGSGKTTLARLLLGLAEPDPGGVMRLDGEALGPQRTQGQRRALQIVFQNPASALNPAHSVRRLIGRSLARLGRVPPGDRRDRLVLAMARAVQLPDRVLEARPSRLSGGQKQRVAIARAFAGAPRLVVCDEPTSSLDVSVRAAILNLLADLQAEEGTAYLLISHDLASVRFLADRVAVLYLGRLMEIGPSERVFAGPHHPYTAALLSAAPGCSDARRVRLEGEIPSALNPPAGCVFHTRCPRKLGPVCETEEPPLHPGAEPGQLIRCHIPAAALGD